MHPSSDEASDRLSRAEQQLLCAACGPLSESEARHFGIQADGEGINRLYHTCTVAEQPDFPALRQACLESPPVQRAAGELEQMRFQKERTGHLRFVTQEQLAARARWALLENRKEDALHFCRLASQLPTIEWRLWMEKLGFWESVLGKKLAGADHLPMNQDTQDLRAMLFLRYALAPLPDESSLTADGLPPMARASLILRQGVPLPAPSPEQSRTDRAALLMLSGQWEQAHRSFLSSFQANAMTRYKLGADLGAPLLPYAIINAIQAQASRSVVSCWCEAALNLLPPYATEDKRQEISDFIHNLNLLDLVVNRDAPLSETPPLEGSLAKLPLMLCYNRLAPSLRAQLPIPALWQAIQELEESGLELLARYGRTALQAAGAPPAASSTAPKIPSPPRPFRPILRAHLQGSVLQLTLAILSQGDASPHSPGNDREKEAAERLRAQLAPLLPESPLSGNATFTITGLATCLEILLRLKPTGIPLHWDSPEPHFLPPPETALQLTARRLPKGMWELSSRGPEHLPPLAGLLLSYHFRQGDFLPLRKYEYMKLTEELDRQLAFLCRFVRVRQQKALLPTPLLPAFAAAYPGALPASFHPLLHELDHSEHPVPSGLQARLRPYQQEGYRWLHSRISMGLGACLADDMGLGKTIQTLALLLEKAPQGPSLILSPLSLISNWLEESKRFAPGLAIHLFEPGIEFPPPQAGSLTLASYGQLLHHQAAFASIRWNLLVLDEAQAIKNPDSKRTLAVRSLQAAARLCLTGTPIENKAADLWSIMHFLNPGMAGRKASILHNPSPEALAHLHQITAPLILRRTKEAVLPQLPGMTEITLYTDFSPKERQIYETCRREAQQTPHEHISILAKIMKLRRICCHPQLTKPGYRGASAKLTLLGELMERLRGSGHKALLFSQFTGMLDLAGALLEKQHCPYLRLDGSTPPKKRAQYVQQFQQGEADAFLLSLKAAGTGLNLTAADYVILLDPWWNPAAEAQAISRSLRLGQDKAVTVYRLIIHNTVEERILHMHRSKKDLADALVADATPSLEDLLSLLS